MRTAEEIKSESRLCKIWLIGLILWAVFCFWQAWKHPERFIIPDDYVPKKITINGFGFPSFR